MEEKNQFFISAVQSLAKGKYDVCYDKGIIKWKADATDLPTDEEIETEKERLEAEYKAQEYARKRAVAYPKIGDQLDDLYHKGAFSDEMKAKLKKVKDDFPKG